MRREFLFTNEVTIDEYMAKAAKLLRSMKFGEKLEDGSCRLHTVITVSMSFMPQVCGRTDFSKQLVKDRRFLFLGYELRQGFPNSRVFMRKSIAIRQ